MTVRGKRVELNLVEDYCDLTELECEYCSSFDKRREEILHCDGALVYDSEFKPKDETVDYEIKLWLDSDDGLVIQDHFKFNNTAANYGSFAKFAIKYCPWCGRRLERTKE